MKLQGEFIVRETVGQILAIPVGETALKLNGMILLNEVSRVIWERLGEETTVDAIVAALTEQFDVTEEEAREDTEAFLQKLQSARLL